MSLNEHRVLQMGYTFNHAYFIYDALSVHGIGGPKR